jgi:ubiquinone biosynthesis protein COQ9
MLEIKYLPSLFHYIGDSSINCEKTDEFIDSSLEKIVKLGSLKTRIKLPKIEDIPILRMFV